MRSRARRRWTSAGIAGEVVVADNASEDGSAELATAAGARVVHEPRRGYGSAYLAGFAAARGRYIVMADADLTYDFGEIPRFVERARGRRRPRDGRPDGQHPARRDAVAAPLRRQPGALAASSTSSSAPACATPTAACARFRRDVLPTLDLRTTGHGVRLRDGDPRRQGGPRHPPVPDRVPPARRRVQARRRFRDGWRHLRFLLVHSPTHLFIIPGAVMVAARRARSRSIVARAASTSSAAQWDLHAMIAGVAADDRRHAGARARPLRARLRHVLHGRARPVVRPHARALPARARPAARRRDRRSPAS